MTIGSASMPAADRMLQRSPIERLPQELLFTIFSILVDGAKPLLREAGLKPLRMGDVPWLVLPSVCRWWRKTSDLCLELWTTINFWEPETTDKLWQKSKGRNLELIFVSGRYAQFSSKAAVYHRSARKLRKNIFARARSIKFVLEEMPREEYDSDQPDWEKVIACSNVVKHILETPAPVVVSLHLANTFDFEEMSGRDAPNVATSHRYMKPSDYPMLRSLYLDSWISVPPTDLFFSIPLTSLTFARGVYFDSFLEFLDVLSGLPTIEVFNMDDQDDDIFYMSEAFGEQVMTDALSKYRRDPGSIELPRLKLLDLTMSDTDLAVEIMRWIVIPPTTHLVLRRVPFMVPKEAEEPDAIQEEVIGLLGMLVTYFASAKTMGHNSFQGLGDLVATTGTSMDEKKGLLSTLCIRANHCQRSDEEVTLPTVECAPQLDVSLSFRADELQDNVVGDVLSCLLLVLGNDATKLRLSTAALASGSMDTPARTIYHAAALDNALTMHPLGLIHLKEGAESISPASTSVEILPHLAALEYYGFRPTPTPHSPKPEDEIRYIGDCLQHRVEAGTLREVAFYASHISERDIEALKEQLDCIVRWEGMKLPDVPLSDTPAGSVDETRVE
ncbi:unnamed protein product [Peniophora sp. CBMAI 1063]|nr:unnamed protein product [Peniophora sp. CBMAI 1063]